MYRCCDCNVVEKFELKDGNILKIVYDEYAENPLTWTTPKERRATFVMAHRRYMFADEEDSRLFRKNIDYANDMDELFSYYIAENFLGYSYTRFPLEDEDLNTIADWIDTYLVVLPVYMYDHGGITINTTGFSCPWDSEQIGFIYAFKKDFKQGEDIKAYLEGVIKEVNYYIEGNVYGYIVEDKEGNQIDSCYGYYGDYKYILEEFKDELIEE